MGQHYSTLLSIGIPIMIGQMGMIVLSFADTMMVGHHSTTELGAASFVNNIMNLAIITGIGGKHGKLYCIECMSCISPADISQCFKSILINICLVYS